MENLLLPASALMWKQILHPLIFHSFIQNEYYFALASMYAIASPTVPIFSA